MSLQLILISLPFYPLVLLHFTMSPSLTHVMYPFARFPFARFLEDIVQVESPMIRTHTCEFIHTNSCVINHSIRIRMWSINHTISSYDLKSPCVRSHLLRFLAYLLNLYVDTWSCLHVCPSLAYYGKSYFAQQYKSTYIVYLANTDISRSDLSLPWTSHCRFPSFPMSSGLHHWGNKSLMGN